jgi:hypothetical protein
MGCGGEGQYSLTLLSPLLYQAGAPRVADMGTCMDMKAAGLSLRPLEESFHNRAFKFWLIPHGDTPFTMVDYYDNTPLFESSVIQTFRNNYSIVATTRYYDVYEAVSAPSSLK